MITSRFTIGGAPAAVVVSLVIAAQLAWSGSPALGAASPVPGRQLGSAAPGTISTIAGGVGGPAPARTVAFANGPTGLAYAGGHLYVTDAYVRAISMRTGGLTTPVGAYSLPSLGFPHIPVRDGHPAVDANTSPDGVDVAADHNLLVADTFNGRVRVVAAKGGTFYGVAMKAGDIYTVAGNGSTGFSGDGGPARKARVNLPMAVAADQAGNLVFADSHNNRIRVVAARAGTFYGVAMKAGDIYTVAGDGKAGFSGDGGPATRAELQVPSDVAVDGAGNLVLADRRNDRVRVVAARAGTFYGVAMKAGDIYTVAGDGKAGFSGDGGPAIRAELDRPEAAAVDGAGNLVVSDTRNDRVRVVAARAGTFYGVAMKAGDIYTVAGDGKAGFSGDGGPAAEAKVNHPFGVLADGAGNLVLADTFNGRVRVVAARAGTFYGVPMTAGDIYTIAGVGLNRSSGIGDPAAKAVLNLPNGVAVDHNGNLLVSDTQSNMVWAKAARTGTFYGQHMTAGDVYSIAGDGTRGFSGDGGPAISARLDSPWNLAVDHAGNVLMTDVANLRVRVVAASTGTFYGRRMTAGDIYTVAGDGVAGQPGNGRPATKTHLDVPRGIAVDRTGNLVISTIDDHRVQVVAVKTGTFYGQRMTAGDVYTVARSGLLDPQELALDRAGNVVVADEFENQVRVVAASTGTFYGKHMITGHLYPVAGDGTEGFSGDGGPAAKAELNACDGVAVDHAGNLVIGDTLNNRVRVVAASTGTFYGQHMTDGDIYTIAGDGPPGFSGDGGLATKAWLAPEVVVLDRRGDLIVADTTNERVRRITARPGG